MIRSIDLDIRDFSNRVQLPMGFPAFWTHVGCKGNTRKRWSEKIKSRGCHSQTSAMFLQNLTRHISPWNLFDTWSKDFFILYILAFLMHTTCRYPWEKFHWISSSARTYVRINYEEKRKIPQRASRDLPIQTTWWYSKEQFPWNFIFCTCICTHKLWWQKQASSESITWKSFLEITFLAHAYVRTSTERRMLYEMNWICINVLH